MNGVAIIMAAGLAAAQPADPPAQPPPEQPAATASTDCRTATPAPDKDEIVVCAEREEGYRINPDVLEANRAVKNRNKPRPRETMRDRQ